MSEVLHLSYSPGGGAGLAAQRIVSAQRQAGLDASFVGSAGQSVSELPLAHPAVTLAAIVDQLLIARKDASLITAIRSRISTVGRDLASDAAIINLHWIPGMLGYCLVNELLNKHVAVYWTLHDLRPLTGACHFSKGCNQFHDSCSACPQLRAPFHSIARRNLELQKAIFERGGISLVAPSAGILEQARQSSLATNVRTTLIPNPIPLVSALDDTADSRQGALFVAADVEDKRKGLTSALSWWRANLSNTSGSLFLVGKNSEKYTSVVDRVRGLGVLHLDEVALRMRRAAYLIFASEEDNAPGVVLEALQNQLPILGLSGPAMIEWLRKDGVPLLSQKDVLGSNSRYAEKSQLEAKRFLASRTPRAVGSQYAKFYGL